MNSQILLFWYIDSESIAPNDIISDLAAEYHFVIEIYTMFDKHNFRTFLRMWLICTALICAVLAL